MTWFFACWYKFLWIKSESKIFGVGRIKNGFGQLSHGTLKLTVSQVWIDGGGGKLKAISMILGWAWSNMCVAI